MQPTEITIQRSDILFDPLTRERQEYLGIPELADSINSEVGLIQPVILSPIIRDGHIKYLPIAGGRRLTACDLLGVTTFYFGNSGIPGKPGFVLSEESSNVEKNLMAELTENKFRQDFTWQEELNLLCRAYEAASKQKAIEESKSLTLTKFGQAYGYSYNEVQASLKLRSDLKANPQDYANTNGLFGAYGILLNKNRIALESELESRRKATQQVKKETVKTTTTNSNEPTSQPVFNLSNFHLGNSINHLESLKQPTYDCIITDPDFAISVERLESNSASAGLGVAQESVAESLSDLKRFIQVSYLALHDHGYLVFFYDLDHHEKLQQMCSDAGFAVQRWPIIWHKVGFASNANANKNTTKDIEYAMVASKSRAKLATPGLGSVVSLPVGRTATVLGHPFAKSPELWRELFRRFVQPGYTVFDAFMGSGSMPIAAIGEPFTVVGMELNPDHYNRCIVNLQNAAKAKLGPDVTF